MSENRYEWIPGQVTDPKAIARMRDRFPKPPEPMGEAWFMGEERRMYIELMAPDAPAKVNPAELSSILAEIGGTFAFGHRKEWDDWFRYLLPDLVLRSSDSLYGDEMLVQYVVTAFMAVFWKGIQEEYSGFRQDVIDTLSHTLMNKALWQMDDKDQPSPVFLLPYPVHFRDFRLDWHDGKADPNVSALMFFCLKYLTPDEIQTWSRSLFSISNIFWKGNLLVWLYGAYDMLKAPIVVPTPIEKTMPQIRWEGSQALAHGPDTKNASGSDEWNYKDEFLQPENVTAFLRVLTELVTPDLLLEWMEEFSKEKLLHSDYFRTPELLYRKLF